MGGLRKTVFFVSGLELTSSSSEQEKINNHATKPTSPQSIEKIYTEQSRWDEGKIHADMKNFQSDPEPIRTAYFLFTRQPL